MKWISVKERLPDSPRDVVCLASDLYDYNQGGAIVAGWVSDHWRKGSESMRHLNITHWMELPAPPTEEA